MHACSFDSTDSSALKSGSTLFKSSLFSLQLSLLLPSIRPLSPAAHPTPAPLSPLLSTLQLLRPFLLALPTLHPTTPRLSLGQYPNLPYPSPGPPDDAKWLMTFLPPKEVQIVGDWALETCSHSSAKKGKGKGKAGTVEMALMMDEAAFQEKDFLNGRYFYKRVYWLAVVGHAITSAIDKLGLGAVEWAVEGESEWKPVLVLRSKQGATQPVPLLLSLAFRHSSWRRVCWLISQSAFIFHLFSQTNLLPTSPS